MGVPRVEPLAVIGFGLSERYSKFLGGRIGDFYIILLVGLVYLVYVMLLLDVVPPN